MLDSRMMVARGAKFVLALALAATLAACAANREPEAPPEPVFVDGYGPVEDDGYTLPGVPSEYLAGVNRRMIVPYFGDIGPGNIEVDPFAKFLFYVLDDGFAVRYPIAVGREGKGLRSTTVIRRKEEWPGWTPTANMVAREPEVYADYAGGIPGGLRSPLGARALYLYQNGRDTHFRIHGTNDLGSIGNSGSAGCIRLFNQDVIDLYDRIEMGTKVYIRSYDDSVRLEGEALANRGVELPPVIIPAEELLGPDAVAADHAPVLDDQGGQG